MPLSLEQDLEPSLVKRILALNRLDAMLYNASLVAFERALESAKGPPGSTERERWDADAAEYKRMQAALASSIAGVSEEGPSPADSKAACAQLKEWYTLRDTEYEALVDARGFATVPPAATAEAMTAAYERSGGTRLC